MNKNQSLVKIVLLASIIFMLTSCYGGYYSGYNGYWGDQYYDDYYYDEYYDPYYDPYYYDDYYYRDWDTQYIDPYYGYDNYQGYYDDQWDNYDQYGNYNPINPNDPYGYALNQRYNDPYNYLNDGELMNVGRGTNQYPQQQYPQQYPGTIYQQQGQYDIYGQTDYGNNNGYGQNDPYYGQQTTYPTQEIYPTQGSTQQQGTYSGPQQQSYSNNYEMLQYVQSNLMDSTQMSARYGVYIEGYVGGQDAISLQYALEAVQQYFGGVIGNAVERIVYVPNNQWGSTVAQYYGEPATEFDMRANGMRIANKGGGAGQRSVVLIREGAFSTPQVLLHELGHVERKYNTGTLTNTDSYADAMVNRFWLPEIWGTQIARANYA